MKRIKIKIIMTHDKGIGTIVNVTDSEGKDLGLTKYLNYPKTMTDMIKSIPWYRLKNGHQQGESM